MRTNFRFYIFFASNFYGNSFHKSEGDLNFINLFFCPINFQGKSQKWKATLYFLKNFSNLREDKHQVSKVMYYENIEESSRFILTQLFYPRGYFCGGYIRFNFFVGMNLNFLNKV